MAWITRDHCGQVTHHIHARDAFTRSPNRLVTELRGTIWVMKSVKDLRVQDVVIASDYHEIVKAIARPELWPQYKALVDPISALKGSFASIVF